MLKSTGVKNTIVSLVNQLLPRIVGDVQHKQSYLHFTRNALRFCVEVYGSNFGYDTDTDRTYHPEWVTNFKRFIHIIITTHPNVFVAVTENPKDEIPIEQWYNSSNHDTCWKTDGFNILDQVLGEAYKACWRNVPKDKVKSPHDSHVYCDLHSLWVKPFSFVRVDVKNADNWKVDLLSIENLEYKIHLSPVEKK